VAAAFFGMTAYQLLLNAAELNVPAATASIVVAAAPLVSVAIATVFLDEQLTLARVAGSLVAIGGVVAISLARSGATLNCALLIAVGAAVVQGIYHALTKPLLRERSGIEVATYAMVAGTVMSLPFLPWGWHDTVATPLSAWASALYLGLLPSALGFVLWGYAVARLPLVTSTSLLYLVPAFAVLIGFVWLGEVPLLGELLGGLVVIAGVVLVGLGDRILRRVLRTGGSPLASSAEHLSELPGDVRGSSQSNRGERHGICGGTFKQRNRLSFGRDRGGQSTLVTRSPSRARCDAFGTGGPPWKRAAGEQPGHTATAASAAVAEAELVEDPGDVGLDGALVAAEVVAGATLDRAIVSAAVRPYRVPDTFSQGEVGGNEAYSRRRRARRPWLCGEHRGRRLVRRDSRGRSPGGRTGGRSAEASSSAAHLRRGAGEPDRT
jgi:drug/metabolite transporter (DMT)-like permease